MPRPARSFSSSAPERAAGGADAPGFSVERIDHFVLTVRSLEKTLAFYRDALGFSVLRFGQGRLALACGEQKINLHEAGSEFAPHAANPGPGSADLCCITQKPVASIAKDLEARGLSLAAGPVRRAGARGPLLSIYLRDPDGNLVELANPLPEESAP